MSEGVWDAGKKKRDKINEVSIGVRGAGRGGGGKNR